MDIKENFRAIMYGVCILFHVLGIALVLAFGIYAHFDYQKTHNPDDLVIEAVVDEVLEFEGIPVNLHENKVVADTSSEAKNVK